MRIGRRWVIGSLVGAGALGALAVGVAVASPLGDGEKPRDKVIERAEAILGLESGRLEDALEQAQADIARDRRDAHLDQLVKDGVITQAEADEIKAWLDSMPEAVRKIPGKFGLLPGVVPFPVPPEIGTLHHDIGTMLDKLIEDGAISQEQANEMRELFKKGAFEHAERFRMREFRGEFGVPHHPRFSPGSPHGLPFEWKLPPGWKPKPAPTPAPGT